MTNEILGKSVFGGFYYASCHVDILMEYLYSGDTLSSITPPEDYNLIPLDIASGNFEMNFRINDINYMLFDPINEFLLWTMPKEYIYYIKQRYLSFITYHSDSGLWPEV